MKRLLIPLLSIVAFNSHAEDVTPLEFCTGLHSLTETIFSARFAGVPLPEMLATAEGSDMTTAIILDAYDVPEYQSPEVQARATREGANRVMLQCLDIFKED